MNNRRAALVLAVFLFAFRGQAQTIQAVVNIGDWTPRLTLGTIGAAFGQNLAASECVAQTLPLPNELCGVQVTVSDDSGAQTLAPLFYVSPTQVNFYFPATQWLTGKDPVRRQQQVIVAVEVCISPSCFATTVNILSEPAILEWQSVNGPQPVMTHADGRVVTQDSPAEWGEILILYGIGFGAFTDASGSFADGFPADGYPAPTDRLVPLFTVSTYIMQVTSEVGGLPVGQRYVYPEFVGLAPGWVGLAQINFQVSCLLSNTREPRVFVETLNQTRTQAFTIQMSEAAKAAWGGRDCR